MSHPEVRVVERDSECRGIALQLEKYDVISVDAEGVQLGKDGQMTLLQIGTLQNEVYVFDVKENRNLFDNGKLRNVLENDKIVKVIHSCSGDSAALYYQFKVQLQNVFDTQVAHIVIQEHKGTVLVPLLKLEDICTTYSKSSKVSDQKQEVRKNWIKEVGSYWAKRPLTDEMIEYAAGDVTSLIPEVYETQKKYIEENGLWAKYLEYVEEEVKYDIDESLRKKRLDRLNNNIQKIVSTFPKKFTLGSTLDDIEDEDDLQAIKRLRWEDAETLHPVIKSMKTHTLNDKLNELSDQLDTEGSDFMIRWNPDRFLRPLERHPDPAIQARSRDVRQRINDIMIRDVARKYHRGTSLNDINPAERDALKSLRPKGQNDARYHPTVLKLYWDIQEEIVDDISRRLSEQQRDYKIPEGLYKKMKFFISNKDVPINIKQKAKQHLQRLDTLFGRGRVPFKQ